jgi:hypothetical protein
MFIQYEILEAFMDDFMVLPAENLIGNVYAALAPHAERHSLLFALTH